ncbi:MAG: restriction endonuclease subunit S [Verrucomicrobiota bacterium]
MKTLGSIVTYKKGKPPKTGPHGRLPVLSPHYLRTGQIEDMAEPTSKDVVLKGGELILLWDGSNAGEFFRARAGVLSSTMVAFEFDEEVTNPDYLYYDLKRFEPELKGRTAGSGIPHVDKEVLLARRVFEGGPDEQKAAAKVLIKVDHAIKQTEALLAKQQRIKAGLMHDLLTLGLDSHDRLRDSSTSQFKPSRVGEIPIDWNPSTVGAECDEVCVGIVIRPTQYYAEQGPIALRSLNVQGGFFDLSNVVRIRHEANERLSKSRLRAGDVVTVRTGEPGTSAVVVPELEGANCIDLVISRPGRRLRAGFLALWMNSAFGKKHVFQNQGGLAQQHFNVGAMKLLPIPIPDVTEQDAIVVRGKAITSAHDELQETLVKLRRLKSGLMHDLLTGRVPVTPLLPNSTTLVSP